MLISAPFPSDLIDTLDVYIIYEQHVTKFLKVKRIAIKCREKYMIRRDQITSLEDVLEFISFGFTKFLLVLRTRNIRLTLVAGSEN